jgi:Xaa-Pro aminopeptidase
MRLKKVQRRLGELDALLITNPVDLFYMTGIHLSAGKLLVKGDGAELFVDGRYTTVCEQQAPFPLGDDFGKACEGLRIGFDSSVTSYESYTALKCAEAVPLEGFMAEVRSVKEPEEVERLRRAADLARRGCDYLVGQLREGASERELVAELEIFWLQQGGEGHSFEPIVAFGENSALPHHRPGERRLKRGDLVLLDMGVQVEDYQSDMTRVEFFGDVDPKLREIHDIVMQAYEAAVAVAKEGVDAEEVDRAARSIIEAAGYELPHGLGHGVGLEVHELPRVKSGIPAVLEAGNVITIEPGIYLPGLGGVRYENTLLVTEGGLETI